MTKYSEPMMLARAATEDFRNARHRYYTALREALPVGTPIRFTARNGRLYAGNITRPIGENGYAWIINSKTGREYEISIHYIRGLYI